uniref:Resolvase HTH domain-containing protein n=1 Tax=Lepeophtheirus salmonis TaxID=72036 RepID=A0A0K2TSZ7_LEPSM
MERRRVSILELSGRGKTPTEIAKVLNCSRTPIYSVVAKGTSEAITRSKSRSRRSDEMVAAVKKSVEDKRGKVTVSGLSREFNVSRRTMDLRVKKDLGLKVYKVLGMMTWCMWVRNGTLTTSRSWMLLHPTVRNRISSSWRTTRGLTLRRTANT